MAVKYKPEEHYYRVPMLHHWFAWGSVLLLIGVLWMIYDDWARPWKAIQREWRRVERFVRLTQAERAAAEAAAAVEAAEAALAEARAAAAEHRAEARRLEAEVAELDRRIFIVDQGSGGVKPTKAKIDEVRSRIEKATTHGHEPDPRDEAELAALTAHHEAKRAELEGLERERREIAARREALEAPVVEAEKALEKARAEEERLRAAAERLRPGILDAIRNAPGLDFADPSIRIVQVLPEGLTESLKFSTRAPRADRCQTCHLGIDKPDFAVDTATGLFADPVVLEATMALAGGDEETVRRWARVFGAHSRLDLFVGGVSPHPLERFACSICHEGQGRQTDFSAAWHVPDSPEKEERWRREFGWVEPINPLAARHAHRPMLPLKHVEATCQRCHFERWDVPASTRLHRGLTIVSRLGCYACHRIDRFEGWPRPAPSLRRIGGKLTPEWVQTWLADPQALRPGTPMPRFFGHLEPYAPDRREAFRAMEDVERAAISAFLFSMSDTAYRPPATAPPPGDPARGRELFESIGCRACHTLAGEERDLAAGSSFGPPLVGLSKKVSRAWLFAWLKDPRAYDPSARMPSLRLSDAEAADLVAFLMEQPAPGPAPAAAPVDPGTVDAMVLAILDRTMLRPDAEARVASMSHDEKMAFIGRRAVSKYGCYSCHEIAGFEGALPIGTPLDGEAQKPLAQFDFAGAPDIAHTREAWLRRKITAPRVFDTGKVVEHEDRLRMPDFGLSDTDADDVLTVLLGLYAEPMDASHVRRLGGAEKVAEAGRRLLWQRNCIGCHAVEGRGGDLRAAVGPLTGPPLLDDAGERLQADWLFGFLKDPSPRIRPTYTIRMPTFGLTDAEANAIITYLARIAGAPFPFETDRPVDSARAAEGERIARKAGCFLCHFVGDRPPAGLAATTLGPSFSWARTRLRRDWIVPWLQDPQARQPGSAMPGFWFAPDGRFTDEQIAEMEAVREYLWSVR